MPSHNHTGAVNSVNLTGSLGGGGIGDYRYIESSGVFTHNYKNKMGVRVATEFSGSIFYLNASHSHTLTINGNGAGQAHNNMIPYLAVYIWTRID